MKRSNITLILFVLSFSIMTISCSNESGKEETGSKEMSDEQKKEIDEKQKMKLGIEQSKQKWESLSYDEWDDMLIYADELRLIIEEEERSITSAEMKKLSDLLTSAEASMPQQVRGEKISAQVATLKEFFKEFNKLIGNEGAYEEQLQYLEETILFGRETLAMMQAKVTGQSFEDLYKQLND